MFSSTCFASFFFQMHHEIGTLLCSTEQMFWKWREGGSEGVVKGREPPPLNFLLIAALKPLSTAVAAALSR